MEKQKRWQGYLILAVIVLTLYNILPTVFYYSQPLRSPIDAPRAAHVGEEVAARVNSLEEGSKEWLAAFCKLLSIQPEAITLDKQDPRFFHVTFAKQGDALLFKRFLPRAGVLIPFVPAQLELLPETNKGSGALAAASNDVLVMRQVGVQIDPQELSNLFHFTAKYDSEKQITPFYRELVHDRVKALALALGSPSQIALEVAHAVASSEETSSDEAIISAAREINEFSRAVKSDTLLAARYYPTLVQSAKGGGDTLAQQLVAKMEALKGRLALQKKELVAAQKEQEKQGYQQDSSQEQTLYLLDKQLTALETASLFIRQNISLFKKNIAPLTANEAVKLLATSVKEDAESKEVVHLQGHNPFVEALVIDWNSDIVTLQFFEDLQKIRHAADAHESEVLVQEKVNQFVFNDILRASRLADEKLKPFNETFAIQLNQLTDANSFLALDLGYVATKQAKYLVDQLNWSSAHPDLTPQAYPILLHQEWKKLP